MYFKQNAYYNVFVIRGGWQAWLNAEYPVEDK
jgi:3-mercaptopyruvate sulfurtransferase SseA